LLPFPPKRTTKYFNSLSCFININIFISLEIMDHCRFLSFFLFWSLKSSFVSSHHVYLADFEALNAWSLLIHGQLENPQHTCITKAINSTRKNIYIYIYIYIARSTSSILFTGRQKESLHDTSNVNMWCAIWQEGRAQGSQLL
jgi:hypothetical protein